MTHKRLIQIQLIVALAAATSVSAQRALPFSDDALVLGFGQLRTGIHGSWSFYDQVYTDDGKVQPLGHGLSFNSAGSAQFGALSASETAVRAAAAQSGFQLSLGTTAVSAAHRTGSTALLLDVGLPGRLMISVEVPFVRVENTISIRANDDTNSANVGINPASTGSAFFAADTALANQIARAGTALNAQLTACMGSTSTSCAALNARRSEAQNLVASSGTASAGILALASAPFAPLAGSAAQAAITTRVTALASAYREFGINSITGTTTAAAGVPITAAQYRDFLERELGALPTYKTLTRLGDISAALKFRIADGGTFRAAAFGRVFFPTGGKASPGEFFPLAAGDEFTRSEAGGIADLFIGRKASVTALASAVALNATERRTGITASLTPRYALNPWILFGARMETRTLGDLSENKVGAGFSFSNLSSSDKGPRFPVEASFFHSQTISGKGLQPRIFSDEFRIRIFARR